MQRLMVADATLEALARALGATPGLLCNPGELTSWLYGLSRYRREGSDRPEWLKLWSGVAIDQERLGRGATYVSHPHVCLFGELQPDRIGVLTREVGNDGLLDRFLVAWPNAEPLPLSDAAMPGDAPVVDLVATLTGMASAPSGGAWIVTPSAAAFARYRSWHDDENLQAIKNGTGAGRGWAAKAPLHVQRLALILHLLWTDTRYAPAETVSLETMERAITLVEAFRAHHERLVRALNIGEVAKPGTLPLPERVLGLLRRRADWVTASDLVAGIRTASMTELEPLLADLVAAGTVEARTVETKTKPSRQWRVSPEWDRSPTTDSANSANLEKPRHDTENGTSAGTQRPRFAESAFSANLPGLEGGDPEKMASDQGKPEFAEFAEPLKGDTVQDDFVPVVSGVVGGLTSFTSLLRTSSDLATTPFPNEVRTDEVNEVSPRPGPGEKASPPPAGNHVGNQSAVHRMNGEAGADR
jgi:hypothetical protein